VGQVGQEYTSDGVARTKALIEKNGAEKAERIAFVKRVANLYDWYSI